MHPRRLTALVCNGPSAFRKAKYRRFLHGTPQRPNSES
jgi:hypothetical protein